jgi:hypothetical protein
VGEESKRGRDIVALCHIRKKLRNGDKNMPNN